jgi:peptidoglycan-N-acetylglucosamine deacetylase
VALDADLQPDATLELPTFPLSGVDDDDFLLSSWVAIAPPPARRLGWPIVAVVILAALAVGLSSVLVNMRSQQASLRSDLEAASTQRFAAEEEVARLSQELQEATTALGENAARLDATGVVPLPGGTAPDATAGSSAAIVALAPGQVALTFDDGPYAEYTPAILDILDRYKVKATFFVVGQEVERHPELVRDMAARGHVVANHTWNHRDLTQMSDADVERELTSASDAIEELVGKRPSCMRPPMGKVDDRVRAIAGRLGLTIALWDVDTLDFQKPPPEAIVERVLPTVAERGAEESSSILLHDGGGDRTTTIAALPQVIEGIQALGRPLVPLCT